MPDVLTFRRVCTLMGLLAGGLAMPAFPAEPSRSDDPIAIRSLGGGCVLIQRLRGPGIILAPERRQHSVGVPGVLQLAVLARPERETIVQPRSEFVEVHRLAAVRGQPELAVEHVLPGNREGSATLGGFRVHHRAVGRVTQIEADGLRVLYFGDPAAHLSDKMLSELTGVDVLLLPLPGGLDWPSETIAKLAVRQVVLPLPTDDSPEQRAMWSAAVGSRPMGTLRGGMILVQQRCPIWPELLVGLPAAVVWLSDQPAQAGGAGSSPEWSDELTRVRTARAAVWEQLRGVSADRLDARDRFGEMSARFHAEHAVGRDLTDVTRLVARPRANWLTSLEWDTRPGPAGFAARTAGLPGTALIGLSARAARWAEELLLAEFTPPAGEPGATVLDATMLGTTEQPETDRRRMLTALEWTWRHRGEQIQRRLAGAKTEPANPASPDATKPDVPPVPIPSPVPPK